MAAIPPSGTVPEMVPFCIQVPNSSEWLGLVTGALLKLTYGYYWDKTYENWEDAQSAGKAILASWLEHNPCAADLTDGVGCTDFPLSSAFISFYPLSPYLNPSETPDGWSAPPFSFVESGDIALGFQSGDLLVTGFPNPDSGDLTVPSMTVHVSGEGQVEIHLLMVPNGGMATITIDGDLLNSQTFDLNADLVGLPPESDAFELSHEVNFDTSGDHTVEVRFVPALDDTLIPIRYGGGIRAVVLCGFDSMSLDVRQNPTDPCELQKTYDGSEWTPFADLSLCLADGGTVMKAAIPKQWRFSGGKTQVSLDGGATFYDFPDGEAADYGQVNPTYPTGVDKACLAARNLVATLEDQVDQWRAGFTTGNAFLKLITIITGLLLALGTGGVAAPAVMAFIATLVDAGNAGLGAMFTESFYLELECEVYNAVGSDGIFSSEELAALDATMLAKGSLVWTITETLFSLIGLVGVNNSLTLGGVDTCADAPCLEIPITYIAQGWAGGRIATGPATCPNGSTIRIDSSPTIAFEGGNIAFIDFSVPYGVHAEVIFSNAVTFARVPGSDIPKYYTTPAGTNVGISTTVAAGAVAIFTGENHDLRRWYTNGEGTYHIDIKLTKL